MEKAALEKISYGLYVLGVPGGQGGWGGCIVDAVMQVTSDEPAVLALASMKKNQTNLSLKESKDFTLSVLSKQVDPFVVANFGFQSSREVDKWANVPYEMMDGVPALAEYCARLRCTVKEFQEFSTHTLFLCTVLDAATGKGEPLLYEDYRRDFKNEVFAAFQVFKKQSRNA